MRGCGVRDSRAEGAAEAKGDEQRAGDGWPVLPRGRAGQHARVGDMEGKGGGAEC